MMNKDDGDSGLAVQTELKRGGGVIKRRGILFNFAGREC